jgi:integrase
MGRHGEGSVYPAGDGRFRAYITLESGQRKYFSGKTKKEVKEKLKQARFDLQQGSLVVGPDQTLEQYLKDWLVVHKEKIRPRTYVRYEGLVRLHLLPDLGKTPLQKLTGQQLERLYTKLHTSGLAAATVGSIHNMLHTALDRAIRLGLITRNVTELVSPPRKEHKEMRPLSPEEVKQFLEAAKGHPRESLFTLALATGMRRGELLALKWQDINLESGVLHVRRSLTRMYAGQGYKETEPKTKSSRRSIALAPFAIEVLKKHWKEQQRDKARAAEAWEDHDYVFCDPDGTHLDPGYDVYEQFKALLKEAGLPDVRFHDLRHSTATLLLSKGVHPKVVQEILGHSAINITMDTYSHVLPTMQKDALEKLDDFFS